MLPMGDQTPDLAVSRSREPWFAQRPRLACAVAGVLTLAIFALQLSVDGVDHGISLLYVFPVALVALAFGARAGVVAGVSAIGLVVLWALVTDVALSLMAWVSTVLPLLLLGALVGASSDRIREARRAERYATAVALLQRDAVEINDSIVQGLAAAKWALEAGDVARGLELVEATAVTAQQLVTRVLGSDSVLGAELRQPQLVRRRHHSDVA